MKTRVVVTGMGAITPIGNDVESFWQGLKSKTVGIGPITYFDTTDFKCKLAAEVKGFHAKDYMDQKAARRMEAFSQFAVAASREALEQAGIDMEKEDPYRVGVCVGSGIGSLQAMEKDVLKMKEKGPSRVNPLLVPMMISNMAAGNVAIQFGLKGKCFNVVTACATGTHSIGEAMRSIQYGEADVMVAGGSEASITPIGIAGFTALTALNTTSDPMRASIPFDEERNGFVMGEGAGVVVLESLEHAQARGARILAEVAGYGATCDAYHITSPAEDGSGAARAMENALSDAGMKAEELDYVNAPVSYT
ncbi:beta-ketoacyl-ACP synthase II, partial [uncultured Clostridium sp.]|uniref:beta-ketoacyl-ACP synthase II n=1 Tax=uncultured Clostridium sp. TaxID=59620 RepID=UPI002585964B